MIRRGDQSPVSCAHCGDQISASKLKLFRCIEDQLTSVFYRHCFRKHSREVSAIVVEELTLLHGMTVVEWSVNDRINPTACNTRRYRRRHYLRFRRCFVPEDAIRLRNDIDREGWLDQLAASISK